MATRHKPVPLARGIPSPAALLADELALPSVRTVLRPVDDHRILVWRADYDDDLREPGADRG